MNKSFKAEFLVEGKWATNALRFASKEEADASVSELMSRWYVPEEGRAAESGDPVSHKFDFVAHRNVPVEEAAPVVPAAIIPPAPAEAADRFAPGDLERLAALAGRGGLPERSQSNFDRCDKAFRDTITRIAEVAGMKVLEVFGLWGDYADHCDSADQSAIVGEFVEWYSEKLGGDDLALMEAAAGYLESRITEVFPTAKPAPAVPAEFKEGDWIAYTDACGHPQVNKVDRVWVVGAAIPGHGARPRRIQYTLLDASGNYMASPDYSKPITLTAAPAAPVAAEEEEDAELSVITFPVAAIPLVEMPPMPPVVEPAAPVVGLGWLRRMRPM